MAAREHGAVAGATSEGATEDSAGTEDAASALDVHAADEATAAALDENAQESVEGGLEDMIADAGSGNAEMAVHVVTEEEAAAGMYSVHEVLLPLPGFKVALPRHAVAKVYEDVLAQWGLSAEKLAHRVKELALPGSYRRLLQRPLHLEWSILRYSDPTAPLAPTDLTRMRSQPDPLGDPEGTRIAVRLEFTLPPSTYATMCLRELTKQSSELGHQLSLNERAAPPTAAGAAGPGPEATTVAIRPSAYKTLAGSTGKDAVTEEDGGE